MDSSTSGAAAASTSQDYLVIVGSSAGGIEALSTLVSGLPADFPVPMVLAQHLDPTRQSSLVDILRHRAALPVKAITSHTPLRAGAIYVVPENRHVTISDGYIETQGDHLGRPKPSLDLLLTSAAHVYGERLIAVILTGLGSNGAVGAIEVKRAGGTVIVQNPQTARFPSMPQSLPPTIVDMQVDLERLGPLLYELLMEKSAPFPQEQQKAYEQLLSYLTEQEHVSLRMYKPPTLMQHIRHRQLLTGTHSFEDYLDYVRAVPAEGAELARSLLVTYTEFFRDSGAFHYLKQELLPELIAHARERNYTLRCWSAGCATGEEAFSLAMLLADLLEPEMGRWKVTVFATDVSEAAIAFARRGVYAENVLKGLPAGYQARFFEHADHGYRVVKVLRQMVVFGRQDVARMPPFSSIDLVLCRNVLSYLTPAAQASVLNRFAFSLFPEGYLMLGRGEAVRPNQTLFMSEYKDWNVYRCLRKMPHWEHLLDTHIASSASAPSRSIYERHPSASTPPSLSTGQVAGAPESTPAEPQPSYTFDPEQLQRYAELLLRALPIRLVVLDRSYRVVTANRLARRLLRLPTRRTGQDFFHAAVGLPYARVRSAVDEAFRERSAMRLSMVELDMAAVGSGHIVELAIAPLQVNASLPELALVSLIDMTEQVKAQRHLEEVKSEQAQLLDELGSANKRLNEANQNLLRANEELLMVNEDMILTQEELQARLEELETTQEELRSSFEDLEGGDEELRATSQEMGVANEELQATTEELQAANEELSTRLGELEESNVGLADERRKLAEVIDNAPLSLVSLSGSDLRVEMVSRDYAARSGAEDMVGRFLADIERRLWPADLQVAQLAAEVYRLGEGRRIPAAKSGHSEGSGAHPALMLTPTRNEDGTVSGVIIYAIGEPGSPGKPDAAA